MTYGEREKARVVVVAARLIFRNRLILQPQRIALPRGLFIMRQASGASQSRSLISPVGGSDPLGRVGYAPTILSNSGNICLERQRLP